MRFAVSPIRRWRNSAGRCAGGAIGTALLALAVSVLELPNARAQAPSRTVGTIAPLLPQVNPRQPSEITNRFHQALATGAAQTTWRALDAAQVRSQLGDKTSSCAAGACVGAALRSLERDYGLTAQVDIVGKNYTIEVAAYRRTKQVRRATGRCDICTLREALGKTTELAQKVCSQLTPATRSGAAAAGPDASSRTAAPAPKEPTKSTKQTPPKQTKRRRRPAEPADKGWPLWPALAAGGAAALALSIGIPLLVVDGNGTDCRGSPRPDNRNCERVYSTAGGGWVMTSFGLASLAASGVLLYLHLRGEPEERRAAEHTLWQLSVVPSERGVVVGAGGTF
jgi:hypothetical protein